MNQQFENSEPKKKYIWEDGLDWVNMDRNEKIIRLRTEASEGYPHNIESYLKDNFKNYKRDQIEEYDDDGEDSSHINYIDFFSIPPEKEDLIVIVRAGILEWRGDGDYDYGDAKADFRAMVDADGNIRFSIEYIDDHDWGPHADGTPVEKPHMMKEDRADLDLAFEDFKQYFYQEHYSDLETILPSGPKTNE